MDAILAALAAIRAMLPEGLRDRAGDGDFVLAAVIWASSRSRWAS
jgi:hypothetical protein